MTKEKVKPKQFVTDSNIPVKPVYSKSKNSRKVLGNIRLHEEFILECIVIGFGQCVNILALGCCTVKQALQIHVG